MSSPSCGPGKSGGDLQARCRAYLKKGPPPHMTDYVPESLTEVIIAYGANAKALDPELREIAQILVDESGELQGIEDREIREYMQLGAELVSEVLKRYGA